MPIRPIRVHEESSVQITRSVTQAMQIDFLVVWHGYLTLSLWAIEDPGRGQLGHLIYSGDGSMSAIENWNYAVFLTIVILNGGFAHHESPFPLI